MNMKHIKNIDIKTKDKEKNMIIKKNSSPVKSAKKKQDTRSLTHLLSSQKEKNKPCKRCRIEKTESEFKKSNFFCDGCGNIIQRKSKNSLTTDIYRYLSKKTGDEPLCFSKDEFGEWLHSNDNFDELYIEWLYSNFNRQLRPCCIKIDDKKPLSLENIRLIINTYRQRKPNIFDMDVRSIPEKTSNHNNVFQRISDSIMMFLYMRIMK